jgi:hypothetical protein
MEIPYQTKCIIARPDPIFQVGGIQAMLEKGILPRR